MLQDRVDFIRREGLVGTTGAIVSTARRLRHSRSNRQHLLDFEQALRIESGQRRETCNQELVLAEASMRGRPPLGSWLLVNISLAVVSLFVLGCGGPTSVQSGAFVRCRTQDPGKPAYILEWKFEAVRKAIVDEALSNPKGIRLRDLTDAVMRRIPEDERKEMPAAKWLVDVVTSELQARQAIAITKHEDGYFVTLPSEGG
jgi:hypothetical protein